MAVRYPLHLLFLPCQLILSKDTIWNQFLPYLFSISELPDQICSGLKPKQGFCAECSAWHLKLKLCSSCRARHHVSSHSAGTSPSLAILLEVQAVEKIIKKFSLWSTQILLSENWICRICINPNFLFFCKGWTPMFMEMLQNCAGVVEGSVGPWAWERLWRQQWVVPQHPLTDVALLFKSKQRNTSFSV